jgi:hypothetical protein
VEFPCNVGVSAKGFGSGDGSVCTNNCDLRTDWQRAVLTAGLIGTGFLSDNAALAALVRRLASKAGQYPASRANSEDSWISCYGISRPMADQKHRAQYLSHRRRRFSSLQVDGVKPTIRANPATLVQFIERKARGFGAKSAFPKCRALQPYLDETMFFAVRAIWMTFEELTEEAAKLAEKASARAMRDMAHHYAFDEDDVTGVLVGNLHTEFDNNELDGIRLRARILRHRKGVAAEERRIGADMLIHIGMDTSTQSYSKGVLIQAKKSEATDYWSARWRADLVNQCNKMLNITPSAFVFSYSKHGIRCGAATRVVGAKNHASLRYLCGWTSYRFFLELFRCPIGDPRISSAKLDDLPVPFALELTFSGDLALPEDASL